MTENWPNEGEIAIARDGLDGTPSLPYAGTSGFSGSEASEQATRDLDQTGRTSVIQREVRDFIAARGSAGATVVELRRFHEQWHHGRISSALTCLHKDGKILRLTAKRERASIYVAPQFLLGRDVVPPKAPTLEVEVTEDMDIEMVGMVVYAALLRQDKIIVRRS